MKPNYQHVAVGVISNAEGKLLISQRGAALAWGGLWEFPGGKLEAGETPRQALDRELQEELGITVISAEPLITLTYQYPDVTVKLYAFSVGQFAGMVCSTLGQVCHWVAPAELNQYPFLAANKAVICAAQLPAWYAILDDAGQIKLMDNLDHLLACGITLIQARLKQSSPEAVGYFLDRAYPLCKQQGVKLLINSAVPCTGGNRADGIHLTRQDLLSCQHRPENQQWVAASCHNLPELLHAQKIGVDFVVLSPVQTTLSHPGALPLGWQRFAQLVEAVNLPVYGLGGLATDQLDKVRQLGGQGIAAIRAFSL